MPPKLPLTWRKALIRGPDFRAIVEKKALNLEKQELVSITQILERDLTTGDAEWTATFDVFNNNNNNNHQACKDCEA